MAQSAFAGLLVLAGTASGKDRDGGVQDGWSLGDLTIEQLMNESITSVSKREQRLGDAAAAVSVLTGEDLRRGGSTTLADALRVVPGLQVAAMDAGTWAITARGFNSQFANKLQVMMDGRTVYLPLFSGVLWDAQQTFLDDVDRIEIIRGPGATVWGANAVNGVINLVSKSARDTQGGLVYSGGGNVHLAMGGARYGAKIGETTFYRVYGTYQLTDDYPLANGRPGDDSWDLTKVGFRVDHYPDAAAQLTWQGDVSTGNVADGAGDQIDANTIVRWTHRFSERSGYEILAYLNRFHRQDTLTDYGVDTADVSAQQTIGLGAYHDIIWGLSYRFTRSELDEAQSPAVTVLDDANQLDLFSAFVQDEITLVPDRLKFTLGTKVEHNEFTGWEAHPSARAIFKPTDRDTVWAAVSHALRTPSESESLPFINFIVGNPIPGPGGGLYVPTFIANPRLESEKLLAYEIGYRTQPASRLTLDAALFYHQYEDLVGHPVTGFIPGTPVGMMTLAPNNGLDGHSYGSEISVTLTPTDRWRLSASYSTLFLDLAGHPAADASQHERNAPTHQLVLRSSHELPASISLDAQLRYVDNVDRVPAYLTADLRLAWRPHPTVELALVGQNLLDDRHPEQASAIGSLPREIPRGVFGKLTWHF